MSTLSTIAVAETRVQDRKASSAMDVYRLNPLEDPRWPELLGRHPEASIFHTPGWLKALRDTYGYQAVAFTTSRPGAELRNGVVFCEVNSWLTGRRLVSLPFSDHCQPLLEQPSDLGAILSGIDRDPTRRRWKYVELRPLQDAGLARQAGYGESAAFAFHKIDLRREPQAIYKGFHDSCIRRKIKKAEKEQLTYEAGRSRELLEKFFRLMIITRRRHQLPPQPLAWFANLMESLGDRCTIHLASKGADPAAAIITLLHKETVVYKYGCSDGRFNNLGGTPLLFWKIVQAAKQEGAAELDLGRSDPEDPGLVAFKGHLGGIASELHYYRTPAPPVKPAVTAEPATAKNENEDSAPASASGGSKLRSLLATMPEPIFVGVGRVLYRHMG